MKIQPFKLRRRFYSLWSRSINGFTLLEVLIVVVASAVIFSTFTQSLISHIRSSATLEAMLRSQDKWMRLQSFLDIEISEAEAILVVGDTLTLTVPCSNTKETTTYALADGILTRTGPKIDNVDGSLNCDGNTIASKIMSNIELIFNKVDASTVSISINISDPSGYQFKANKAFAVTGRPHSLD